jgi:hypothetical protein
MDTFPIYIGPLAFFVLRGLLLLQDLLRRVRFVVDLTSGIALCTAVLRGFCLRM